MSNSNKLAGGIAIGTIITGCAAYIFHKNAMKTLEDKLQHSKDSLSDANSTIDSQKTTICSLETDQARLQQVNQKLEATYENLCSIHNKSIISFNQLLNLNMIADISELSEEERNECLRQIENATGNISRLVNVHKTEFIDTSKTKAIIDRLTSTVDNALTSIEEILEDADDDDDDNDDDDVTTIAPKKILLAGIDGSVRVFETDPDDGFEVIDGSDPENNDYCIIAQNVPKLYNVLFASIKDQLSEHLVSKIELDAFDRLLEDMVITVSLAFVNDEDALITAVNAVVPFELFTMRPSATNKCKIYYTKEGEVSLDNVIRYYGGNNSDHTVQNGKTSDSDGSGSTETSSPMEEKKMVTEDMIYEHFDFIIESIGYNRESLKSFLAKLMILKEFDIDAGYYMYTEYADIVEEIHRYQKDNLIDDTIRLLLSDKLRTLNSNMKKLYGAQIRSFIQTVKTSNS